MAWSVTTLAWGLIEFKSGYETAGEYNEAVDQIMWVTDYFVKCHTAPNEFWGQVGDGNTGTVSKFIKKTGNIDFLTPICELWTKNPHQFFLKNSKSILLTF